MLIATNQVASISHPINRKRSAMTSFTKKHPKRLANRPLSLQRQIVELTSSPTNQQISQKRPKKDVTLPCPTAIARLQAPDNWLFSQTDKSRATEVRSIGAEFQSVKFHPFWSNFSTAGIRGTKPFNGGVHYWQILIPGRIFGTSMMIGIGTQHADVHSEGFVHLLGGGNDESWGLCHNGYIYHNGTYSRYTSPFPADEPVAIGVLYDGFKDTLTFYRNGRCLGVAFSNLLTHKHLQSSEEVRFLFPMLSSTSAQTEMVLCSPLRNYTSLQDRCRAVISHSVSYSNKRIADLPLPDQLKHFIQQEISTNL